MALEISVALARIWGGFFLTFGVLFLLAEYLGKVIEMTDNKSFVISTGYISFLMGLVTVVLHNVWSPLDWKVFITILGWSTMIKGIMKIAFPEIIHKRAQMFKSKQWLSALCLVAMGGWLLWMSFA